MKVKGGKALSVVNNCLAAAVFILILVAGMMNCQVKCNSRRDLVQTNLAEYGNAKLS